MISENKIIRIEKAQHIGNYRLKLIFNDGTAQIINFFPFLSASLNPLIRKYLDMREFLKFNIDDGDLEWNDYDLCFPIADLYENSLNPPSAHRKRRSAEESLLLAMTQSEK